MSARRLLAVAVVASLSSGCTVITHAFEWGPEDAAVQQDGGAQHSDAGADAGHLRDAQIVDYDAGTDAGEPVDAGACAVACADPTPRCDPSTGECVACIENGDCDDFDPCTVDRCGVDHTCSSAPDYTCVEQLTLGFNHTCARRGNGDVWCWGEGRAGELGNGVSSSSPSPVRVSLGGAVDVDADGSTTCAARGLGEVRCWGDNYYGQLGNGTDMNHSADPQVVMGLSPSADATAVAVGNAHACALRSSGQVACWGQDAAGQLGSGTCSGTSSVAVSVLGISDGTAIACGDNHCCVLRPDGHVRCWGDNTHGELGEGVPTCTSVETDVPGVADAVAVTAGHDSTCALRVTGDVVCWGWNVFGQLGNGTADDTATPTAVIGLHDVIHLSAGRYRVCAIRSDHSVACWGGGGPLGDGTTGPSYVPVVIPGLFAVEVSAGFGHACARQLTGGVVCWGSNTSGQLGDGTMDDRLVPTPVVGL